MEFQKVKAVTHDLKDLLSSSDCLINKDEDEVVEIESLKGKTVGFYFSAIWSRPCQRFTRILIETYEQIIKSSNGDFEIVFVSADENEKRFEENMGKMPWIAIPYLDSETRSHLDKVFEVRGLPHLAIVDDNGKLVLNDDGVEIVRSYGAEAYPFKPETIQNLKHRDEVAKINPSFTSIFASRSRVVSSSTGNQVAVSDLEGKIVGLYFTMFSFKACVDFTPKLVQVYQQLKANGESFEIVMIRLYDDEEEEDFESNNNIPWLSIPFKDKISTWKLVQFFNVSTLPTLVIIGKDGKILQSNNNNVKEAIEEHGVLAFPFTPKRLEELRDLVREKEEALTLDSLLVSGDDQDFVITKDGEKIPMEALSGKNILLYFSANWSWQCRAFNDQLMKAYENINEKEDDDLEVVFISSDKNEGSYKAFFSEMPWLSLPYRDSRNSLLKRTFKIHHPAQIPKVVAFGVDGRFVTKDVKNMIKYYGAEAYPFTEERLNEMMIELRRRWPGKVKHKLHKEHELVLEYRGRNYRCNKCFELGILLSFCCPTCDFDLHYKCAMG